jgi:hypothetical protein
VVSRSIPFALHTPAPADARHNPAATRGQRSTSHIFCE